MFIKPRGGNRYIRRNAHYFSQLHFVIMVNSSFLQFSIYSKLEFLPKKPMKIPSPSRVWELVQMTFKGPSNDFVILYVGV